MKGQLNNNGVSEIHFIYQAPIRLDVVKCHSFSYHEGFTGHSSQRAQR